MATSTENNAEPGTNGGRSLLRAPEFKSSQDAVGLIREEDSSIGKVAYCNA